MTNLTFGEALQQLFRQYDAGAIGDAEFEQRKHLLLDRCRGRLPAFLPRPRASIADTVTASGRTALLGVRALRHRLGLSVDWPDFH